VAKAAGPLVAAAIVAANPAPPWLLTVLLAVSLVSLACFLAAVNSRRAADVAG
jgi:hypothetical protein